MCIADTTGEHRYEKIQVKLVKYAGYVFGRESTVTVTLSVGSTVESAKYIFSIESGFH